MVGLDPRIEQLPGALRTKGLCSSAAAAASVLEFNRRVIEAVAPYAVAVKPQAAFHEALGWRGFRALEETIKSAREAGLLVIADAKRGDIGPTAEAYATAILDRMDADAATVNPYFGEEGIAPFLSRAAAGKGIFVLVRTSNPSSAEIQDLATPGGRVCERVARMVARWGEPYLGECGYSAVGGVVGATFPNEVSHMRSLMPRTWLLLPGYGAQGATAQDCAGAFDAAGLGGVVNSSRAIIYAFAKGPTRDWQKAIAEAARRTRDELEEVRSRRP